MIIKLVNSSDISMHPTTMNVSFHLILFPKASVSIIVATRILITACAEWELRAPINSPTHFNIVWLTAKNEFYANELNKRHTKQMKMKMFLAFLWLALNGNPLMWRKIYHLSCLCVSRAHTRLTSMSTRKWKTFKMLMFMTLSTRGEGNLNKF
jgi:hypothetical protein